MANRMVMISIVPDVSRKLYAHCSAIEIAYTRLLRPFWGLWWLFSRGLFSHIKNGTILPRGDYSPTRGDYSPIWGLFSLALNYVCVLLRYCIPYQHIFYNWIVLILCTRVIDKTNAWLLCHATINRIRRCGIMLIGGHGLFSTFLQRSYLTTKHLSYLILMSLSLSLFSICPHLLLR